MVGENATVGGVGFEDDDVDVGDGCELLSLFGSGSGC